MNDAYPETFDDGTWSEAAGRSCKEQSNHPALPGPPLTQEQLIESIREGDASGMYEGDAIADAREKLKALRRASLAA